MVGRQANEIWARLEILKACCRLKYSIFRFVQPRYGIFSATLMLSNALFRQILLQACFIKCEILRCPMISYRFLLFIAIAMNDKHTYTHRK